MSEFAKKYDLKESQMTALIKDGWLTCSIATYDKVVYHYNNNGRNVRDTAVECKVSVSEVYYILNRFK